jgi:hypothetical protein
MTAATAVPTHPFRWQGGVVSTERPEAQMVAAAAQDGVATWQLATNAMAGSNALGVEPLPQHHGPLVDAISDHDC